MHGTRAVQRLIEYLSTPEQVKKIEKKLGGQLSDSLFFFIIDQNGHYFFKP